MNVGNLLFGVTMAGVDGMTQKGGFSPARHVAIDAPVVATVGLGDLLDNKSKEVGGVKCARMRVLSAVASSMPPPNDLRGAMSWMGGKYHAWPLLGANPR
jgi:hypothetical protein